MKIKRIWIPLILVILIIPACYAYDDDNTGFGTRQFYAERLDDFIPSDPWTLEEAGIRFGERLTYKEKETYRLIVVDQQKVDYWLNIVAAPPMIVVDGTKYYRLYESDYGFEKPKGGGIVTMILQILGSLALVSALAFFIRYERRKKKGGDTCE